MKTFFADPVRVSPEELEQEIQTIQDNPIIGELMQVVGGLIAVLDDHRQVLAVNTNFLTLLGIDENDVKDVLGLRLGEALRCVHAKEPPAGCGTTQVCASCGAAIAMVTSLATDQPAERICALKARPKRGTPQNDKAIDMVMHVRAHPMTVEGIRLILIFLKDITNEENRIALERTFFHDISNSLSMLMGTIHSMVRWEPSVRASAVQDAAMRIIREVAMQRRLVADNPSKYCPLYYPYTGQHITSQLEQSFADHPELESKTLTLENTCPNEELRTDLALYLRIASNMILNALEASEKGGEVVARLSKKGRYIQLDVTNSTCIDPSMQKRIFQRHFSTKAEAGRGLGTYSMKLFGEKILKGEVSFVTSIKKGTTFTFKHPLPNQPAG